MPAPRFGATAASASTASSTRPSPTFSAMRRQICRPGSEPVSTDGVPAIVLFPPLILGGLIFGIWYTRFVRLERELLDDPE